LHLIVVGNTALTSAKESNAGIPEIVSDLVDRYPINAHCFILPFLFQLLLLLDGGLCDFSQKYLHFLENILLFVKKKQL